VSGKPTCGLRFSAFTFLVSLATLEAVACRVDRQEFQNRVFGCDTSAADPLCGTDLAGHPMQCFAARQIGAADFCTEECGDVPMSLDDGTVCVQGGAKLKACKPSDDGDPAGHPQGACGRSEFGCLRTDILKDEGVCLTMHPCVTDQDCHDPVRSVCAATFLKNVYAGNTDLETDHLYCLQEGCDANNSACSPGETCLRKVISKDAHPPDICVPNCDSLHHCPPNHFCLQKISGPGNPAVCIPGLLGFVCDTDIDCLVGTCMDDGGSGPDAGDHLHLCSRTCSNDDDCSKFDGVQGLFICAPNGHCATPDAYRGASCSNDGDCLLDAGAQCMRFAETDAQGTCLHACPADGACLPRGGINQTCLPLVGAGAQVPVCFPGYFGIPCFAEGSCVGDLTCRRPDLVDPSPQAPGMCTALCVKDDDCANDRWTRGGWCGVPDSPICFPAQDPGSACTRDGMCSSGICNLMNHLCN
jgi:hypothetical protein